MLRVIRVKRISLIRTDPNQIFTTNVTKISNVTKKSSKTFIRFYLCPF